MTIRSSHSHIGDANSKKKAFAIPHCIMRKLIRDHIADTVAGTDDDKANGGRRKIKVSKDAFLIAHSEIEKFLVNMFEVGHELCRAASRQTMQAHMMKAAVKCNTILVRV